MTVRTRPQTIRWHVYPGADEVRDAVVEFTKGIASDAIARNGSFSIVLAGGETPRSVYERLAGLQADWSAWHVYFGDERCLPFGDSQRNSTMADSAWLKRVGIPRDQVHRIPAELGAQAGAEKYALALRDAGDFDLVLLGLGEDGHTASLFPGRPCAGPSDDAEALAVDDAPKPPSERVTLSATRLSQARYVAFVVSGPSKREAVRRWRAGEAIPASKIAPPGGVDVFIDEAASSPQVDPWRPTGGS